MMKQIYSLSIGIVTAALSIGLLTGIAAASENFDASKEVVISNTERVFKNINPAIKMADVYGNKSKGMHGTFGQFPANFDAGFHTHSGAYHGVVIKGTMTNPFKGEKNPKQMGAGSYWYVPANSIHSTACISDTPCEFYFYADSKFDFFPIK